jgi:hypothetical protein
MKGMSMSVQQRQAHGKISDCISLKKEIEHLEDQPTLSQAGIANSAAVDEELKVIRYEMACQHG